MARRSPGSKKPNSPRRTVSFSLTKLDKDTWSLVFAAISLVVSIVAIVVSVRTARWGSPYFYAAPGDLSYAFTQSNVPADSKDPASSNITVAVYNDASTPARNVRILFSAITEKPEIKCDQPHSVLHTPWGGIAVDIRRISANGKAKVTLQEKTDSFPPSFDPSYGLKYQYAAKVESVDTEFGAIRCRYNRCAVFFVPKSDDSVEPYVRMPRGLRIEDLGKEPYPDATLMVVPRDKVHLYNQQPKPMTDPR